MSRITCRGFVLRQVTYGEAKALIEILCAEQGLLTVGLQGSKQIRQMACQPFVFAEFQLFYNKSRYRLDDVRLINAYESLHDLERLSCLAHMAEVFRDLLSEAGPERAFYELWAFSEHQLATGEDPLLSATVAVHKALCLAGFGPWLGDCLACHADNSSQWYFSLTRQGLLCEKTVCLAGQGQAEIQRISGDLRQLLFYIHESPAERLFNFTSSAKVRSEFVDLASRYLESVMEKAYHRLDLLRRLQNFDSRLREGESCATTVC